MKSRSAMALVLSGENEPKEEGESDGKDLRNLRLA